MTNEKIKEILDRCKDRFGWVQIHMDTEENYLLMPLADLVDLLEKQLPKKPSQDSIGLYHFPTCPNCHKELESYDHHCDCGQRLDWEVIE